MPRKRLQKRLQMERSCIMAVLKKNVNLALLLLVVLVVGAIVAISVYYQKNYLSLFINYQDSQEMLNTSLNELQQKRAALNRTEIRYLEEQHLNEEYDRLYSSLKQDRDSLSDELERTATELGATKTELLSTKDELNEKTAELATAQTSVQELEQDVAVLETRVSSLESQKESLQEQLSQCQAGE